MMTKRWDRRFLKFDRTGEDLDIVSNLASSPIDRYYLYQCEVSVADPVCLG